MSPAAKGLATEPIVLTAEEVPVGSTVYICGHGTTEPVENDKGRLGPVMKLVGGVSSMHAQFYPVEEMHRGPGGSLSANGYSDVPETTRFTPSEAYFPADSPLETEYAVFVGGKRMTQCDKLVRVFKTADGIFVTAIYCSPEGRRWDLPEDAQLIPTSELGGGTNPERSRPTTTPEKE
jgi:hypothetical protein